jgi:hypothetical protein
MTAELLDNSNDSLGNTLGGHRPPQQKQTLRAGIASRT